MSVCTWCSPPPTAEHGQPLHSHNDYWRRAPLLEALDAGCISIEADVFAHNGELAVAHDRNRIQDNKTLTAMYLEPLAKIVRERKKIYPEENLFLKFENNKKNIYDEDNGELINNFCKNYLFKYIDNSKIFCNIHEK